MPKPAGSNPRTEAIPREAALTAAESDVLEQLRRGLDPEAIARASGRSVHTVRTISRNIREKFGARSIAELLAGLDSGTYAAGRKAEARTRPFDLASALDALDRAQSAKRDDPPMRTVRLHRAEIAALLVVGEATQAIVCDGQRIAATLDGVVGHVERLLSAGRDERAVLAGVIAREMGVRDGKRGTQRGRAELARFAAILARQPYPLRGPDREAVLESFRASYAAGRTESESATTLADRMSQRGPAKPSRA